MKAPYALFPVIILVLLVYTVSFIASRLSIITNTTHRKIWNSLLLVTFLTTACLGLILAIQVNYKLKIPVIENILTWHVDFGIAMAIIALFHFSWHFKYYSGILKKNIPDPDRISKIITESTQSDPRNRPFGEVPLKWIALALGFSAIITQVILLREFMSIFYGNELVIGVVLANWMILTGLGAFLGKYSSRIRNGRKILFYSLILLGIIPILTLFLLNFMKNIVFLDGSMVGLVEVFALSGIILIPFCMLSGSLFTFLSHHLSYQRGENLIHRIYSLEAIGSVLGGLIFNFILVYFLRTFQSLMVLFTINLFIALFFFREERRTVIMIPLSLFWLLMLAATFFWNFDMFSKQMLYNNQELIHLKETPYGNLAITKTGDQLNFYENSILLFNTLNTIANEESVHYAMVQHPDPKSVLLISGGVSGILDEILKYSVERIDYVELNPWLIRAARKFQPFTDNEKIHIYNQDARLFVRRTTEKYDVVLIQSPPPGSAHLNRFYTYEFFMDLKESLSATGLIAMALPSSMNYLSNEAADVHSIIFHTLSEVFTNVEIIPGEADYFLASLGDLNLQIASLIDQKGIKNEYVNQYYIDDALMNARRNSIMNSINDKADLNFDFIPRAYIKQIAYWLSYFNLSYWVVWLPVFLFIPLLFIRWNPIQIGMFTCGFSASAIEILLIIAFQIIYGYVYQVTGIIITLFMAGLAAGPIIQKRIFPLANLHKLTGIQVLIASFAILLPFIFMLLRIIDPSTGITHLIFFLLTFLISVLTGVFFSLSTSLQKGGILNVASSIYGSDLIGSALGALLVAALLFPLLGIINVALLIGGLNLLAAIFLWIRRKSLPDNFVS